MSTEIRPYSLEIQQSELDDLKRRLKNTRWPDKETPDDWSQGLPLAYAQELCAYWADQYDWRRCEAMLNGYDQFITEIDGVDIHFLHIKSKHDSALPLVITHGWPGSVIEFHKVIGPLTDPTAHGGKAEDAFHLVLPTIPGYGFSGKPTKPGWTVEKVGEAWAQLMARLGYGRYGAQGGDWGSAVTTAIGAQDPDHCAGIHINMVAAAPDPDTMNDLTEKEQAALASLQHYQDWDSGYSKQQSTRPQTLGYGLVDSPAGQCAWIVEKYWSWMDCDGHPENVLTKDELLDNLMMYWLPGAGASSGRLYWQSFGNFTAGEVKVPTGCSLFPKEIFRASQRWAKKRYTDIQFWNEHDKGGHFAAFEQPDAFVGDVRAFFAKVR